MSKNGAQILNPQTFKALPACGLINLTSLVSSFYAEVPKISDDSILVNGVEKRLRGHSLLLVWYLRGVEKRPRRHSLTGVISQATDIDQLCDNITRTRDQIKETRDNITWTRDQGHGIIC